MLRFPYADTLKILQEWGPGCHFFADGNETDMGKLEILLRSERVRRGEASPILALFTELPSNPHLRSIDLSRLRNMADDYGFLVVVDETIGNFANVDVSPYADIIVTSLSKYFSGYANTMGGRYAQQPPLVISNYPLYSLALNPNGKQYAKLKSHLQATYDDLYFDQDAICMAVNSRDFAERMSTINATTEMICDFLRTRKTVISQIFYPKYESTSNYVTCTRSSTKRGYGGLFSILFITDSAAQTFFNHLNCEKGPTFGTILTLACPYAILAHFGELDWAEGHGVPARLVRVGVGIEERSELLEVFRVAICAAEKDQRGDVSA